VAASDPSVRPWNPPRNPSLSPPHALNIQSTPRTENGSVVICFASPPDVGTT